jgi:hypothetical protein
MVNRTCIAAVPIGRTRAGTGSGIGLMGVRDETATGSVRRAGGCTSARHAVAGWLWSQVVKHLTWVGLAVDRAVIAAVQLELIGQRRVRLLVLLRRSGPHPQREARFAVRWRPITIRWIWLVPSKICITFASRR